MQARRRCFDPDCRNRITFERCNEGLLPTRIERAHPPNVASKMSIGNEACKRCLFKPRWVPARKEARHQECMDQVSRHDEIG